jgi:hypothetical protein
VATVPAYVLLHFLQVNQVSGVYPAEQSGVQLAFKMLQGLWIFVVWELTSTIFGCETALKAALFRIAVSLINTGV